MNASKLGAGHIKRNVASVVTALVLAVSMSGCALLGLGEAANPLVGDWNITVESALGTQHQVLGITEGAEGLEGQITSTDADSGETSITPISNVMLVEKEVEGGVEQAVTFDITFKFGDNELAAKFAGVIDGDSLTGEFVTDLGNGTVTGTRAVAE